MESETPFVPELKPQRSRRKSAAIWILSILLCLVIVVFYFYQKYSTEQYLALYNLNADSMATNSGPNGMASMDDYQHWKNATFTIPEYDDIPINFQRSIVKIFMDNGYYDADDQANYFFTKIADRAKDVYAFGYFTGGSEIEMAFLLEKQDYESSALFIIASNGDLLFWKEISSELPIIRSFKQGAKIYTDEMVLVPSKIDGLITKTKDTKYAYLYNLKSKTFDKHYQYTEQEVRQAKEELEREDSYEEDTQQSEQGESEE